MAAMMKHGHALEIASTAAQGLAMHATESYEVVIHDFHLPDMPGIDVCKKLLLDDPGLPTVIVTQKDDQKLMGEAMDIGISQYLAKDDQADYLDILPNIVSNLVRRAIAQEPSRLTGKVLKTAKSGEKELNEARGLFDTLAQEAPIGIFYSGPDGIARYVNKALAHITGYSVESMTGSLWKPKIHPEDRKIVTDQWLENVDSIEPWNAEFRFLKSDGSVAWVIGRTNPQLDTEGKVIGHVGTIADITERKEVEQALKDAEQISGIGNWRWSVEQNNLVSTRKVMHGFSASLSRLWQITRTNRTIDWFTRKTVNASNGSSTQL